MSRFFARAHLPNASSSKASFKNFLPLIGLLGNLHCSEPDQTPPNHYAFLLFATLNLICFTLTYLFDFSGILIKLGLRQNIVLPEEGCSLLVAL